MEYKVFYKEIQFSHIVIIDCLSEYESQTALHLENFLIDSNFEKESILYYKVTDATSFNDVINQIRIEVLEDGSVFRPLIHIEAHGSESALHISDKGEYIPWSGIVDFFRAVNAAMNNQLVSFIATCHAYNFIKQNNTISKFAPAYFCITPIEKISVSDLEIATFTFYGGILKNQDLTKSSNLLDFNKLYVYNSDKMFTSSFHAAMQEHNRGRGFRIRVELLLSELISGLGDIYTNMAIEERKVYRRNSRKKIKKIIKQYDFNKAQFNSQSETYLGYVNEHAFNEIWTHMVVNMQRHR
ncbi:hypothetical protein [Providencia sp. PROV128]|uniref:hypothetical protein n=1 Tax=Providencia sp. PROV128 TaxID=2949838 RepID=UPI00234A9211|nr:hypothetical protein [Providencia sp. PROV128]